MPVRRRPASEMAHLAEDALSTRRLNVLAALGLTAVVAGCSSGGHAAAGSAGGDVPLQQVAVTAPAAGDAGGDGAAAGKVSDGQAGAVPNTAAPQRRFVRTLTAKKVPRMGEVVTDENGSILYRFDKDTNKPPTTRCSGTCATLWLPALVEGTPRIEGEGADRAKIGTVPRDDGTSQVTLNGWPVYFYSGDKKPGSWKGQAVGGTWFVVTKDGKKNLGRLPKNARATAERPASGVGAGNSRATAGPADGNASAESGRQSS